ncbi:MAG: hypothetical protein KatS3mg094_075 [Candidatus Parcubacteria bacterium]|nr:MAG: hypothetical protein KatS3mg094_075 [Candidatus Parcubacteria bacterium]
MEEEKLKRSNFCKVCYKLQKDICDLCNKCPECCKCDKDKDNNDES